MSAAEIRALHVGKFVPPPYAGIETHVDTLLRSLQPDVDCTLVASDPERAAGHVRDSTPYRVIACRSYGTLASFTFSPGIRATVKRELAAGRVDLLQVHVPNPWGDLAVLGAPRELPVVMSWHSDIVRQKRLMHVYGPIQRRAIERADRIVVCTPLHYESSVQLKLPGVEAKIVCIPFGIDFERLDRTPTDTALLQDIDRWCAGRPMILTVGRHVYYKGYEHLLDALAQTTGDAVLVMVGKGPLTESLRARAVERGVAERVRFAGEVSEAGLTTLLHRCDLFTLPSIEPSEAFGIATAEAMACGKPAVVCQLHNGVNYLNRDGETGWTTPPRDSAALARALDDLVRDDQARATMGATARAWVRSEFDVETMRQRTLAMYRSLR